VTIISHRAAPLFLAQLITRVRRTVGDVETSSANQRWSDEIILDALNMELVKMGGELSAANPGEAILSTSMTYTAASDSVALPAGPATQPVFKVEDVTSGADRPIALRRVDPFELEDVGGSSALVAEPAMAYAIINQSIHVRPRPGSNRTLNIWYVGAPYVAGISASAVIATNVATATVRDHGLSAGQAITTFGFTSNVTDIALSSTTATTLVYPLTGTNGSIGTGWIYPSTGLGQMPIAVQHEELISLGASIRLVRGQELLTGPLPPRVGCSDDEERSSGVLARGVVRCGAGRGDDLGAVD